MKKKVIYLFNSVCLKSNNHSDLESCSGSEVIVVFNKKWSLYKKIGARDIEVEKRPGDL